MISLQQTLVLISLGVLVLLLPFSYLAEENSIGRAYVDDAHSDLATEARTAARLMSTSFSGNGPSSARKLGRVLLANDARLVRALIFDRHGALVSSDVAAGNDAVLTAEERNAVAKALSPTGGPGRVEPRRGDRYLTHVASLREVDAAEGKPPSERSPVGALLLSYSFPAVRGVATRAVLTELCTDAALYSLLLAILFLLLRRAVVKPLREITRAANRLADGDTSSRAVVDVGTEVGQLAGAFNDMARNVASVRASLLGVNEELQREVRLRRETETALQQAKGALEQQNDRLARSNKDLQTFVYAASHDLREPLRMVSSYMRLVSRRCESSENAELVEFCGYATDGAERMKRLLEDLLTYCRVGREGGNTEEPELAEVVGEVLRDLRLAIEESQATFALGTLPPLRCSRVGLRQLIQNLVSNAIKFRAGRAPEVRITAGPGADGIVTVTVADNGIGFDADDAPRLFDAFRRLHGREEYPGSGLGLAICKRIVEGWGGRIWAEAPPGSGAAFSFTVPGAPARPVRSVDERRSGEAGSAESAAY